MQNEATFDVRQAYQHLKNLCFPRMTGTDGEREAAKYIEQHFNKLGLETERQTFSFSTFPLLYGTRLLGLAFCISILFISVFHPHAPFISALLAVGVILVLFKATRWGTHVEKLFDLRFCSQQSENIIARSQRNDGGKLNIIFMAHYDSKAQSMPIAIRGALGILAYIGTIIFLLMVLIHTSLMFLTSSENVAQPSRPRKHVLTPPDTPIRRIENSSNLASSTGWYNDIISYTAYFLCALFLLEQMSFTSNKSPGALDNASGVGVLLELARVLSASNYPNVNIIFVATGAEEFGLCGALRFIQEYGSEFDKEKTFLLNYDSCGGSGNLAVIDRYGIPPKRTSEILSSYALDITSVKSLLTEHEARQLSGGGLQAGRARAKSSAHDTEADLIKLRSTSLPVGAGVDSIPIGFRGFEAITISSRGIGSLLNIHSKRDSIENINEVALQIAGIIGQRTFEKLVSPT